MCISVCVCMLDVETHYIHIIFSNICVYIIVIYRTCSAGVNETMLDAIQQSSKISSIIYTYYAAPLARHGVLPTVVLRETSYGINAHCAYAYKN